MDDGWNRHGDTLARDKELDAVEFVAFPKIARLFREATITEKIDGTNAAVGVGEEGAVWAQSRKRLITPEKGSDNYGFAAWVRDHADELRDGLGVGLHFGEWWGQGIQRGYGLDEKRFSLFNVSRWEIERPACCYVVPVLERLDVLDTETVSWWQDHLRITGSYAANGFMEPEGVVIHHSHSNVLFKATCKDDEKPKGQVSA